MFSAGFTVPRAMPDPPAVPAPWALCQCLVSEGMHEQRESRGADPLVRCLPLGAPCARCPHVSPPGPAVRARMTS